jgi:hypothetical protein
MLPLTMTFVAAPAFMGLPAERPPAERTPGESEAVAQIRPVQVSALISLLEPATGTRTHGLRAPAVLLTVLMSLHRGSGGCKVQINVKYVNNLKWTAAFGYAVS